MKNPIISVIIPTLNRADVLAEMLESLLAQTAVPDEVIIVDQSQTDESKKMSENLLNNYNLNQQNTIKLTYIHNPTITGAAQARNIGIKKCFGDIVFFFDDDVVLNKDYIEETLKIYEQYPETAGVGGIILGCDSLKNIKNRLFNKLFYLGKFRDERNEIYSNFINYTGPVPISRLSGGCSSYKRCIIEKELFDEKFDRILNGYSFGEDVDLSLRIIKSHTLLISPFARLVHKSQSYGTERKTKSVSLYLEMTSLTYTFLKNSKSDILSYLQYSWLLVGWFMKCLLSLVFKRDKKTISAFLKGLNTGSRLYAECSRN